MVNIISVQNNQSKSVPRDRWWECVTIENDSARSINLEGWYLYGSRDQSKKELIDFGIQKYQNDSDDIMLPKKILNPGEHFFIYSGPAAYQVQKLMDQDFTNSCVATQKLIWSDKGETIKLIKRQYREESSFSYGNNTIVNTDDNLDGISFLYLNTKKKNNNKYILMPESLLNMFRKIKTRLIDPCKLIR